MTIISQIDGTVSPRRVYLHADTVGATVHPIDIYKEMRTLRATNESLRKFDLFMKASGNDPKGGGKFTERFVTLLNTRIIPFNTSHVLTINGTIITDDGLEGVFAFDKSPLSVSTSVDINYIPPQVEIILVNTGSGVTTQDKLDIASGVWANSIRALTVSSSISPAIEAKIAAIPTNPLLSTDPRLDNIDMKTSDIWNAPVNPNLLVSGSMGEWVIKKLLSVPKFLGLK